MAHEKWRRQKWKKRNFMRDAKHLKFIRSLCCCVCLRMDTVQACHIRKGVPLEHKGGMGMKSSDCYVVSLCHHCHNNEQHRVGEQKFWTDMSFPIGLAENLYALTGNKEKAIHHIIRFNRVLRSKK